MTQTSPTRLFGVLVTFRRPQVLEATMEKLASQTRRLDHLIVVDNDGDAEIERLVRSYRSDGTVTTYVDAGDNLGPAGGYALGMTRALAHADDEDWIFLLDDDDPPYFNDTLERARRFAVAMTEADPMVGGIGVSGGRFDLASGRVVRIGDDELTGPIRVDHVTGGGVPAYRAAAVRDVGLPWAELFFGFEELEYGLRLTEAGYRLYADGDIWLVRRQAKREKGLLPPEHISSDLASGNSVKLAAPTWRRYYSLRNLIVILRRHEATSTALRVSLARGILKPMINLPLDPRNAVRHLAINVRAIRDGWLNRLGRKVAPD